MGEDTVAASIGEIIQEALSPLNSRSVVTHAVEGWWGKRSPASLQWTQVDDTFLNRIDDGLRLFGVTRLRRSSILERVREAALNQATVSSSPSEMRVEIEGEKSIVVARNSIRDFACSIGFSLTDRVKIATIVSELARNIQLYCGHGYVAASRLGGSKPGIAIVARDEGNGIDDLEHVLSGEYRSPSGMGLGLLGCKRLADEFRVHTGPWGTNVHVTKYLR